MRNLISVFTSAFNTIFTSQNNKGNTYNSHLKNFTSYSEGLTTEAIKGGIIIEDITID